MKLFDNNASSIKYLTLYLMHEEQEPFQSNPYEFIRSYESPTLQTSEAYSTALKNIPKDFYKKCSDCFLVKMEAEFPSKIWHITCNTLGNIQKREINLKISSQVSGIIN